ncbi:ERG8, Phosphomevalonate kinase [Myriangium duriaei CBS 260.36]|uniref:Phosphomevalonate kinase n=1 Tax=Myriangium duriaei CBS 260.36 TaxID=1168546 RepID=A0A9P4IZC0_9PEZI|nr:ERG8, Phosphomevalonate kinase [Myriangium duriaei CBS 260.36]
MTKSTSVAVSAPGKVLLAGGYLVLDRNYTGLVFGLDARIHIHVTPVRTVPGVVLSEIVVRSPQFLDAIWEYGYRVCAGEAGVQVTELRADADISLKRNIFIETALSFALSYISSLAPGMLPSASVTILADNDYYSTSGANVLAAERFHDFGVPLSEANKTGLGSSAALVTAFTAALLQFYLPDDVFDISQESSKRKLHNLAQAAHCAAQGKVGSGFDVASAVYGSCLYRRFSPSILASCGEPGKKGFAVKLRTVVDEIGKDAKWDTEIIKDAVKVPQGLRVVMCDVKGGSQTPGMVKTVLAWRSKHGESAEALWQNLQKANTDLAKELVQLAEARSQDYNALKECISNIRVLIREMGEASGVPIEPMEQTRLIDACSKLPGVIGGVVPGAGGYDAVALLIEDRPEVAEQLTTFVESWRFGGQGRASILGVRQEMQGVRLEQERDYRKWVI